MRTSRKTATRLKITFVDMTYPKAGPGASLSVPSFSLGTIQVLEYNRKVKTGHAILK